MKNHDRRNGKLPTNMAETALLPTPEPLPSGLPSERGSTFRSRVQSLLQNRQKTKVVRSSAQGSLTFRTYYMIPKTELDNLLREAE